MLDSAAAPAAGDAPPAAAPWALRFASLIGVARWPILLVWAIILTASAILMDRVAYDPDVLVYFDETRDSRKAFDAVAERFGRAQEVVTLVVAEDGRSALEPGALRLAAALATAAAARPEVVTVRTPFNAVGVSAAEVRDADDARLAEVVEAIAAAQREPGAAPLVPDDRSVIAVAAIIDERSDNDAVQRIAAAHRAIRDSVAGEADAADGFELIQTGRVVIDDAFLRESRDDLGQFIGPQVAILVAVLLAALGSLALTALMVGVFFLSSVGALGALGALGIAINGISSAAPAVLMGLSVAASVHIVMAWQDALRAGASSRQALAVAYTLNAWPVTLSIGTTLVSFLILNVAESPPFRELGNIVAAGLAGVLALTFTALPAALLVAPKSTGAHRRRMEDALVRLGRVLTAHRRVALWSAALVALASAASIATLTIDDTFSHYFDERYEVRRATDLFEDKLSGTTIIDLTVDTGRDGLPPDTLAASAALTGWLTARPEVARVTSLSTLAEAAGTDRLQALAGANEAAAAEGLPRVLTADGRHLRFAIVMRGVSSADTLAFRDAAQAEAERIFAGGTVGLTGMPVLSAELSIGSARSMVVGMAIALTAISLILVAALRSVRLGLVSLVPNLLPIAIAFGLWGVIAGEVSFAATVVAALTYGIVVDDTVHLLAKYQRFRAQLGEAASAIAASMRSVGIAVIATTLTLALSYLPFALSGFLVNRHFGALTALTLLAALLADLLVLPPLLAALDRPRARPAAKDAGP